MAKFVAFLFGLLVVLVIYESHGSKTVSGVNHIEAAEEFSYEGKPVMVDYTDPDDPDMEKPQTTGTDNGLNKLRLKRR